ncbi:stage II sporulation protein P [Metabacillus fastidiosus]|uniref:stage II sporulation protein P n=1 Tax=Metabacillus fastidiosus TaxID=1458 RepID=UPI002E21488D|nr:stage II sporulation protein P [Metabacillus fastidiosus]
MKWIRKNRNMIVTVNGTSIKKGIMLGFIVLVMTFLLSGILTSLKPEYRLTSSSINDLTENINGEAFLHLLGAENRYFISSEGEIPEPIKLSSILFKVTTSINPDDPRSLLGRELPGFSLYDSEIIIAGEGTNYTNMPFESAPPMEVLEKEREAAIEDLRIEDGNNEPKPPPAQTTGDRKVVYIYNSHNTESYLPLLKGETNPNKAIHSKANVTLLSDMLSKELADKGIGAQVEKTNIQGILKNRNWKYHKSYSASREIVQTAMAGNEHIKYLIDIHRDSQPKKVTTATIKGKPYAKLAFIVGGESSRASQNMQFAEELHNLFQKKYPGLSRGVFKKQGAGTNGVFNQDLSNQATLIEFGGVDNNMEELKNAVEAVADVFSEHYWKAEKVDGNAQTEQQ